MDDMIELLGWLSEPLFWEGTAREREREREKQLE